MSHGGHFTALGNIPLVFSPILDALKYGVFEPPKMYVSVRSQNICRPKVVGLEFKSVYKVESYICNIKL